MDTLDQGQGQGPTYIDWTETELVGLDAQGVFVSVTHFRRTREMGSQAFPSETLPMIETGLTADIAIRYNVCVVQ